MSHQLCCNNKKGCTCNDCIDRKVKKTLFWSRLVGVVTLAGLIVSAVQVIAGGAVMLTILGMANK